MIIVFDLGGTNTRVGLSLDGKKVARYLKFKTPCNYIALLRAFRAARQMLAVKEKTDLVVGGVPGVLNRMRTGLARAPHLSFVENKNFVTGLRKIFSAPIILENDSVLVGLGEVHAAKLTTGVVAYIGVGTGIGGARIVNGALDAASFGFEPGHQIIIADKLIRELEQLISGAGLRACWHQSPEKIQDARVWEWAARMLAIALHNTIIYWAPETIILGGSIITGRPGISLERVRFHLAKIKSVFGRPPKILVAKLGDMGGLAGALIRVRA